MLISHSGKSGFSSGQRIFMLNDLLLVPTASKNLLSVYQFFIDTNVFLEFDSLSVRVKDVVTKEMLLEGNQENGLYQLPVKISRVLLHSWVKELQIKSGTSGWVIYIRRQ